MSGKSPHTSTLFGWLLLQCSASRHHWSPKLESPPVPFPAKSARQSFSTCLCRSSFACKMRTTMMYPLSRNGTDSFFRAGIFQLRSKVLFQPGNQLRQIVLAVRPYALSLDINRPRGRVNRITPIAIPAALDGPTADRSTGRPKTSCSLNCTADKLRGIQLPQIRPATHRRSLRCGRLVCLSTRKGRPLSSTGNSWCPFPTQSPAPSSFIG